MGFENAPGSQRISDPEKAHAMANAANKVRNEIADSKGSLKARGNKLEIEDSMTKAAANYEIEKLKLEELTNDELFSVLHAVQAEYDARRQAAGQ